MVNFGTMGAMSLVFWAQVVVADLAGLGLGGGTNGVKVIPNRVNDGRVCTKCVFKLARTTK